MSYLIGIPALLLLVAAGAVCAIAAGIAEGLRRKADEEWIGTEEDALDREFRELLRKEKGKWSRSKSR